MTSFSQKGFCDEISRKCDDKGEGGIPKLCDVIYERSLRELKHFKRIFKSQNKKKMKFEESIAKVIKTNIKL